MPCGVFCFLLWKCDRLVSSLSNINCKYKLLINFVSAHISKRKWRNREDHPLQIWRISKEQESVFCCILFKVDFLDLINVFFCYFYRIIEVLKNEPKGVTQKSLEESIPSLSVVELAQVLNKFISQVSSSFAFLQILIIILFS